MAYYDRYSKFRVNGNIRSIPFIEIPIDNTDVFINYDRSKDRMDSLSYKYYGDPDYGWLILLANPHVGGYEFLIPNGAELRIPYPLVTALNRYEKKIELNRIDNTL